MDDRIEQHIVINAPVDRVWDLVTTPGWWVPSDIELPADRTPGHRIVRQSERWGRFPVEVVEVRPQTYAAFRWASQFPGEDLAPGKTTLVEFFLTAAQDAVTVTVVESGFAALDAPDDVRQAGFKANTGGWEQELTGLRKRAEEPPAT
jgi:uncharacterized protein YndB with AHSA1/START domain